MRISDIHIPGEIAGVAYGISFWGSPEIRIQRNLKRLRFSEEGTPFYENCGLTGWKKASRKDTADLLVWSATSR